MSGFHETTIDGHHVEYGDICEVDVYDGLRNDKPRRVAATFLELTEDGVMWFRCLCEDESVHGSDTFTDEFVGVGEIRYCGRPNDQKFFIGDGI